MGVISATLFEERFEKHPNGDPLYEWRLSAFPLSQRFLGAFGDVKQALNRYSTVEECLFSENDIITNPVSLDEARVIMNQFVGTIEQHMAHLEHLFIQWPNRFIDSYEATDLIYGILDVLENPPVYFFLPGMHTVQSNLKACVVWDSFFKHIILQETFGSEGLFRINDLFGDGSISLNETSGIYADHVITKEEFYSLTGEEPPGFTDGSTIIRFFDEEGTGDDCVYLVKNRGLIAGVRVDLTPEVQQEIRRQFSHIK